MAHEVFRKCEAVAASVSLVAVLGAGLLSGGCRPLPPEPLRVAANPWPGYEFLFLAEHKGFFKEEGVDVHLVETLSLADTRRAFERQHVDVFAGTLVEVLLSAELSGRQPRVFHLCDYSDGADVILAKPPYNSMAGLKGRRVGVEPASVNITLLNAGLRRNGMRMEDVVIVPMAQNMMAAAVARGEVVAAVSYPPVSVRLMAEGMMAVFDSASSPGEIVDVLAADAAVLRQRPRDIAALTRAYGRAQRFAEEHPDEAHAIMARRERITVEAFREALRGIRIVRFHEQAEAFAPGGRIDQALGLTAEALHGALLLTSKPDIADIIYRGARGPERR